MKRISRWTILLLITLPLFSNAQQEEPDYSGGFDKSRLFVGGNFGLSFGNFTFINISPQLGYRFSPAFAAGVGINGQYSSMRRRYIDGTTASREDYGVAGLNVFGRLYPIQQAFLQLQPELNYTWGKFREYNPERDYKLDGKIVPSVLAGAGAAIPAGRGAMVIMIQYDILQQNRSPYGNRPIYNFGYNIGL